MWYVNDKFMFLQPIKYSSNKCVCFDLDGCLITKADCSPAYHKENENALNYVFLYGVENKINEYINSNIQVIIISNQSNITQTKAELMLNIWNRFNQRILFLVAHLKNEFRKPNPTFLQILKCDYEIEFYCGDAIGSNCQFPPFQWGDSDLQFAINANVKFRDPIEVFGSNFNSVIPREQLVIMMGSQGSGKTTNAKRLEQLGFIHMEQDAEHNLLAKFRINIIFDHIFNGKQVIVDACHPASNKRQEWINEAESRGVSWVILWCCRDGKIFNKLRENPVTEKCYPTYTKYFTKPTHNYIVIS